MAAGKWIDDLGPDTPLADAARRVLTVRLEVVRDALPPAIREPYEDVEHVHRLRVATRRAAAALDVFRDCLPPKPRKAARKRLRLIRRAAGRARDWDVFLAGLLEWAAKRPAGQRPGIDFLIGYVQASRTEAQTELDAIGKEYPFDFDRFLAETVAAAGTDDETRPDTLGTLAHHRLSGLLDELDQALAGSLDDYERLHQVRILGKRLRYAMEIFAGCYGSPFRDEVYPVVEQMQQVLGIANDSHVAIGRLVAVRDRARSLSDVGWPRLAVGVEALLRFHRRRLPRQRRLFLDWRDRWTGRGTGDLLGALIGAEDSTA